jgi:hypothetical protein
MINSLGAYVQNVFVSLPSHEASQQLQQLPTNVGSPTLVSGLPIGTVHGRWLSFRRNEINNWLN